MKRASMIIALLLVVVVGAFALDATVTWHWGQNDPNVKYFRHQIDGEDAEKWTVVNANVLEASYDLDVSVEHVFYLQQSYDGENWSVSSSSVLEAVKEEASQVPATEEPVAEELAVEEVKEEALVSEEPVIEPVASGTVEVEPIVAPVVVAKTPAKSRINFGVIYQNNALKFDTANHNLGLALDYTFLFGRSGSFGMGIKAQLSAVTSLETLKDLGAVTQYSDLGLEATFDLLAVADYALSWGDVYFGLGAEVYAPITSLDDIKNGFHVGAAVQLGARLRLGNLFGVGLELADAYYLYPKAAESSTATYNNTTTARVYISFEF